MTGCAADFAGAARSW